MKKGGLLSISELAKFARVSRTALIHYDSIGLISPVARGENNYRYYSHRQVTAINLITTLHELDIPLKDIMGYINNRTPENVVAIFAEQSKQIEMNTKKLIRAQRLLLTLKDIIEEGMSVDEDKIEVRWVEEEPILLGPQIDYSKGVTIEEATHNFYKYCSALDSDIDLNYPVWALFSEERIKRGDWVGPDRFYFMTPDGPDRKPAELYLIGYTRGYYGESDALYKKLMAYIKENGLEICGPTFEEYLLNEISIVNPENYLMRISITVR